MNSDSDADSAQLSQKNGSAETAVLNVPTWGGQMESTNTPRLMVVESRRIVTETLTFALRLHGYDCTPAYDGDEAVSIARQLRPQLILMGVVMPRMPGTKAAMRILDKQPECKIIFLAGSLNATLLCEDVKQRGYVVGIMAAPVNPQGLFKELCALGFDPPIRSSWAM